MIYVEQNHFMFNLCEMFIFAGFKDLDGFFVRIIKSMSLITYHCKVFVQKKNLMFVIF